MTNEEEPVLNKDNNLLSDISVSDTRAILFGTFGSFSINLNCLSWIVLLKSCFSFISFIDQDISLTLDKDFDSSFNVPELPTRPIDVLLDSLPLSNSQFESEDSQKSPIDDETQNSISEDTHQPAHEERTVWERVMDFDNKQVDRHNLYNQLRIFLERFHNYFRYKFRFIIFI